MKIGLLTLPLHTNYGGIIQAWALKSFLEKRGHEVWLIDRRPDKKSITQKIYGSIRNLFYALKKGNFKKKESPSITGKKYAELSKINSRNFIEHYFKKITIPFFSSEELKRGMSRYNFDLVIIGSDQVWRPAYAPNVVDYFGGFKTTGGHQTSILSYAASFGTDEWSFSQREARSAGKYIKGLQAVSVREKSSIEMCRTHFGVDAIHVLDPTMLLTSDDYLDIIEKSGVLKHDGELMTYVLDRSSEKDELVTKISDRFGYKVFSTSNDLSSISDSEPLSKDYLKLEFWLRGFYDASFVVTDSFHACVFSIIFNKPFVVYGNKGRGVSRFKSLLYLFDLEDRYVDSVSDINDEIIHTPIDWEKVNSIWDKQRDTSKNFLEPFLT